MSMKEVYEEAINMKLAELGELRKMRAQVDQSITDLKESYGELSKKIDVVKSEIRLLGGKVPVGNEYDGRMMLLHLREGRRLSDERP